MKKPTALWVVALTTLGLAGCAPVANSQPTQSPPRTAVVAVGDSLSAASNSCGKQLACLSNSWSTGSNPEVDSIASRLQASSGKKYATQNYAVLGTKISGLTDQMLKAIAYHPAYLTVLIGGNDFCASSVEQMTSPASFQDSFGQLVQAVKDRMPQTRLLVASVPSPQSVYAASKDNPSAQAKWLSGSVCQSMLANPLDQSAAATARRAAVVQRANAFNAILKATCAKYSECSYDGGAVNKLVLTEADMSTVDYFHFSIAGQQKVAAAVWKGTAAATLR